jgi:hypothetical protein
MQGALKWRTVKTCFRPRDGKLYKHNGNIVNEQHKHRELLSKRLGSERNRAFIPIEQRRAKTLDQGTNETQRG